MNTNTTLIETIVHKDTGTVIQVVGIEDDTPEPGVYDPALDLAMACMDNEGARERRQGEPYDPAKDPELQPDYAGEPLFTLDVDTLADTTDVEVTP